LLWAALLGSAGWFLLRRTSEEPSNRGVFHGATAYMALVGLLVLVVAVALRLQRRRRLLRRCFLQLSGSA
jgi:membrane protein DedA with SNARE-associated domain